jgi:hypothetical protein
MDSKQSISAEPAEFNTSIGPVRVQVEERDWFSVSTVQDARPYISLSITRCNEEQDEEWEVYGNPHFDNEDTEEVPLPAALVEELFSLGSAWAESHPEEFKLIAADDFDDSIGYIVHDSFDQVLATLKRITRDVTNVLEGNDHAGEFALQAPPQLRELVENAAKMLNAMFLQVEAAGEAIREGATAFTGRQIARPGDGIRPFLNESADDDDN